MKNFKVGLQLYSIRKDMEVDVASALKKVKKIGYDYVEFAGYFNTPAENMLELLDKYGLSCVSVHQTYDVFLTNAKEHIAYLQKIGTKYCAIPWMGKEKHAGTPGFQQTVDEITRVGKTLKDAGIQLLYHNHDFEFEKYENKFLLDCLYDSIPAGLLQTEIDTCWVRYAGYDPAAYVRKYTGRSPVVHLKDFTDSSFNTGPVYALIDNSGKPNKPASQEKAGFKFQPVGYGKQDIPAILSASEAAGTDIVIVEQDESPDLPPFEAARMSRDFLRSLGL